MLVAVLNVEFGFNNVVLGGSIVLWMGFRAKHLGILQLEGCKRPLALLAAFYALFLEFTA